MATGSASSSAAGSAAAAGPCGAAPLHGGERRLDIDLGEVARTQGCVFLIDNSNLWIEGKKAAGRAANLRTEDPSWRVNIGDLSMVVLGDRAAALRAVFGSIPPPTDSVWDSYKQHEFHVDTSRRSKYTGKEKRVDNKITKILARECGRFELLLETDWEREDLSEHRSYCIVGGDADYSDSVQDALDLGIQVELWTWSTGKSGIYDRLKQAYEGIFDIRYLDDPAVLPRIGRSRQLTRESMIAMMQQRKDRTLVFTVMRGMDFEKLTKKVCKFALSLNVYNFMFPNKSKRVFFVTIVHKLSHGEFCDFLEDAYEHMGEKRRESVKTFVEFESSGLADNEPDLEWAQSRWFVEEAAGAEGGDARPEDEEVMDEEGEFVTVQAHRVVDRTVDRRRDRQGVLNPAQCWDYEFCPRGLRCEYTHSSEEERSFQEQGGKSSFILNRKKCLPCAIPCKITRHDKDPEYFAQSGCLYLHKSEGALCLACLNTVCRCPLQAPRKVLERGTYDFKYLQDRGYILRK